MKKSCTFQKKLPIFLLIVVTLIIACAVVFASAATDIVTSGDMVAINSAFSGKEVQSTTRYTDSYVGTMQYTVYHDSAKGSVTNDVEGTPIIVYTINHPSIEKIGTDSDVNIIQSMLDRGYVVVVLDYLGNKNAVSPAIENSTQAFRTAMRNGKIINSSSLPKDNYKEIFVAPSGYNVLLNQVFWEIDKHSAEGTLEKIVENWNSDFRATKGTKLLKWVHTDGTRKAVQKDFDGNSPKWYDASGKEDANGQYTYVKFTKAETITDCVDPDGSFIDMNLYINIVYPTAPKNKVPVMSLANSSGYPTTSVTGADLRPHSNGFLYNGYANVVFDYLWEPMARDASWGYYDGSAGVTQDHMNYALMMYNDKLVNTAAMRYLRYISLSGGNKYNFDLEAFGVYGNSKGGWFSYLGEKILQSNLVKNTSGMTEAQKKDAITDALAALVPDRYYNGHHGETRYQVGAGEIKKDGFTVKAGEVQPWLLYNGEEILSGAQLTNACNGSQEEDITAGHSPIFISGNMTDTYNAAYSYSVNIHNICRRLNIPLLHFEVPIGHTLTSGQDMNYNVDTYDAYFRYVNYYLKDEAISVAYISPMPEAGEVKLTEKIKIGFTGAATLTEVQKITVAGGGKNVSGSWYSEYGGTVWYFVPTSLSGSTEYTVTVPQDFAGDNGVMMGSAYSASFITEYDNATETEANGDYYTLTAPSFTGGNSFVFRFTVANDAANTAELYAVSAVGETSGELLGKVNLRGMGAYEIDITDYVAKNSGKSVTLYLKGARAAGNTTVNSDSFDGDIDADLSKNSNAVYLTSQKIGDRTALGVYINNPTKKDVSVYYDNTSSAFTYKKIVGADSSVYDRIGRRYTISFEVYDTLNRVMRINLNSMTKRVDYGTIDYDNVYFNVKTQANTWTKVEFTYEVYEPDYGFPSAANNQSLAVFISPSGNTNVPVYFDNLKVVENVTDIDVSYAGVAEKDNGRGEYQAPVSTSPFAIYNGSTKVGEYASWKAALSAYVSGYTLKLQKNYTLTDNDLSDLIGKYETVNIDLGNYTVTAANTKNSLLWAKATTARKDDTTVNISGGAVLLGRTALVSYEGSAVEATGKTFNINLNGTYIGFAENSWTTEIISSSNSADSVKINSNVSLNSCKIDLPDARHSKDASIVFPAPSAENLKINYSLTGGEIKLTTQRWITILDNARIVEFIKDNTGNYTKLIMPESENRDIELSFLVSDGYAAYKADSNRSNMITYNLVTDPNSTRYGIIPDSYKNASSYPFVLFKDGVFISAHADIKAVIAAANTLMKSARADEQAEILLRANVAASTEPTYGESAGTVIFDLGGNTITRSKVIINAAINADTPMHTTSFVFKNGRLETASSVIGVTHHLRDSDEIKTFNFTFENVEFGFNSALTASSLTGPFWSIWHNNKAITSITNITLDGCTIDLANHTPSNGGKLFVFNSPQAICNLTLRGGEIIGNGNGFTLAVPDANDTVTMVKDRNGEYMKFTPKSGASAILDTFLCDDGKYRNYQANEDGSFELKINNYVTPYGTIPADKGDASVYPFIIFDENKNFIEACKYFNGTNGSGGAIGKAKDHVSKNVFDVDTGKFKSNTAKAYIVMRRDYTLLDTAAGDAISEYLDNLAQIRGDIFLDLGGYTLSQNPKDSKNYGLFTATSKRWSTTTNAAGETVDYTFPSTISIKNGTINTSKHGIIKYEAGSTSNNNKVFTFNFDNVTFGLTEGATTPNLLVQYNGKNYGGGLKINLSNCTFDLNKNAPTSAVTLINFNNFISKVDTDFTFNGLTILADSLANITVTNTPTSNVSVNFVKGEDGCFATLKTTSATSPYTNYVASDDGNRYFVEMEDDGTDSTYYLVSLDTPYGSVPHSTITKNPKYLSAVDYPFFIFENGSFSNVATHWKGAVDVAEGLVNASTDTADNTAEIVLRRNYEVTAANNDKGNNFNTARGTIIADLNGYTIDVVDAYFIDIYVNYSTTSILNFKSSILIKNGNLKNSRTNFTSIGLGHTGAAAEGYAAKNVSFAFENVTFKLLTKSIMEDFGHTAATGLKIDVSCTDCTFDFTQAASGVSVFDLDTSKTNVISSVKLSGSRVIASNIANYNLYKINAEDSAVIGSTQNGGYMTLTQLSTSPAPTKEYKNAEGLTLSYAKDSDDGEYAIYLIGEPIYTPYGYIPFMYQSTEQYPFITFNEKGGVLYAGNVFYGANLGDSAFGKAKDYLSGNVWGGSSYGSNPREVFIILRRDYVMASNETFNNVAQVQGTITVDLSGHKLKAANDRVIFPACIKPWGGSGDASVFPSYFVLKNGSIELVNKPFVEYNAWMGSSGIDVSGKAFDFTFENIDFTVSGKATTLMAAYTKHSETPTAEGNPTLIFNNCTFDITTAQSAFTLFDLGNGYIHSTVIVNGGEVIANDTDFLFSKNADANATITYGRTENENYTALILPSGVAAPQDKYPMEDGSAVFVKVSEENGKVTYRLRNELLADVTFKPKMSVTLDKNIIFNIYVPKELLIKFNFNGTEYTDLDAIADSLVTLDGEEFYLVKAPLAAKDAASTLKLTATVSAGEAEANATFTFSLVKYAKRVIEEESGAEVQLVLDILSYVRAAYDYFGATENRDAIAQINEILGDNYDKNNAPEFNGSANAPTDGLIGATFILDATPSVRFYLSDGIDSSRYTFLVDGKTLSFEVGSDEKGEYAQISAYAYVMGKTIEYKIDGVLTGSYHINSYYSYAKTLNDAKLTLLVERFAKYCESAEAYRLSVIEE